ncbi:MAG: DASS family sodium-coupled anion symporter [Methylomarinum sp.]|nr:DASS family sodium-coupled anion symporter [Methylomarinum sp.]
MPWDIKKIICIVVPLVILLLPSRFIPIEGFSVVEHRMTAIFLMACLCWILEPIPVFATSVLIVLFELVLISDNGFVLFMPSAEDTTSFGVMLKYQEVLGVFASPIIMLFLGGFFLAMAGAKYRLDINLARVLTKPFGRRPQNIMLGLMIVTALFSMFMSNTATTAMMLAILTPLLALFPKNDKGRIAFALAIPFAANIGGMGTPIGTPPNAVALKYLTEESAISFGTWMSFGVPYVAVMLIFTWLLLKWLYPVESKEIDLNIQGRFLMNRKALLVYFTFVMTILLWITDRLHGMNAYVVAMIPIAVFTTTGIINAKDLNKINWGVLWLVAGGIALGTGLEKTGLTNHIISSIPFSMFSPLLIIFLATLLTLSMATLMSNTATANLLLPLMAALGANLESLQALGGTRLIILVITFSCSLAMSLPVSTPPNAMAYASGVIETRHMAKAGLIIGVVGLISVYLLMAILHMMHFI